MISHVFSVIPLFSKVGMYNIVKIVVTKVISLMMDSEKYKNVDTFFQQNYSILVVPISR